MIEDIQNMNYFFKIHKECLRNNILIINDRIDADIIELAVAPLMLMDKSDKCNHIKIILNTCGGEIGPAFALINVIEKLKTKTTLHLIGETFSAGLYIAMAGHNNPNVTTICTPYTRGMFHSSYVYGEDGVDDKEILALEDFQKRYDQEVIFEYIKSHSNITQEMLDSWKDIDKYFTAKELEELGIAKIE